MQLNPTLRRWPAQAVTAIAAVSMLAACGGSSKSTASSDTQPASSGGAAASAAPAASSGGAAADSGEKVTLTVQTFGGFDFDTSGLYDAYMKLHPNITIKASSVAQEQNYWPALQTHLRSGSGLADVQGIEVGRIADVTQNQADKWVDLDSLGAKDVAGDYFPWKIKQASTTDGKLLALGTDIGPQAVCYRADLFKAAGIPDDRESVAKAMSTWDGYIALGKKYEAAKPKAPFVDSASSLFNAITNQGSTKFYDASGKPVFDTNPAVAKAWDYAMQAHEAGLSAKLAQFSPPWMTAIAKGGFATVACPAWMVSFIEAQGKQAASGKWDIVPEPNGSGNWGGSFLGIPTASKHQKEAYDFIKWVTGAEQQVKLFTDPGRHFPSNAKAASDPKVAAVVDPYFRGAPVGKIFADAAANIPVQPNGAKDGVIQVDLNNGIQSVEQQGKDPKKAWDEAVKTTKDALSG
ncbi:cellobiose transport system substrate-binding protein [Motilibacter rhizosphaerae]|uniref:Cellobiose transport system substrate-binding protein n=1 Tax=Motilibacter rhizosphaerae TaxID=598652 RepID=A0A4Q7NT54_9ACTN|nr:extracellular solute-binding protein [Motilibacter rhizosphaerae]RZS90174.1 cellobiose transport system substrate-binding protein [Motilibacter rhizosphaerae]